MPIVDKSPEKNKAAAAANPSVVITGSTRGLGFALAKRFLELGCRVTISGRTGESVDRALSRLNSTAAGGRSGLGAEAGQRMHGHPCDVSDARQVQALWDRAVKRWGRVDIWINNAGIPQAYLPAWELSVEQVRRLLETNLLGVIQGSRTAMRGMQAQGGGGIYNVEGWGSDGKRRNGLTLYGTTKRAIRYLTRGLADEAEGGPVLVGTLSPGMMVTDFLTGPMKEMKDTERMRRVVNIIGDRPETVARFLAGRILSNRKNHAHFAWLTGAKVMGRFLIAPFRRRDLFATSVITCF
jgi:NAD(P)-dependent dehydrogenase (short-subunit alcohol dehydrogenase family)